MAIEHKAGLINIFPPDLMFSSFFVRTAKTIKLPYLAIAVANATAIRPNSNEIESPIFKNT